MTDSSLPLLPTTVVGSHALPSWLYTVIEKIEAGEYGLTDTREAYNDAVDLAMADQTRAGVDIISDGEMRRWMFVQNFYDHITGIAEEPLLRTVGPYGYDSPRRYRAVEKVQVPDGLGIVEEFEYARSRTDAPLKATCPGPITLSMHIRPGSVYPDRVTMAAEFASIINSELRRLVEAGASLIQLDEPSFAIVPGALSEWVDLFNTCIEGVEAKTALHICFGNLASRPRGKREYEWMWPALLDAKADQLVLEFANRELVDVGLWREVAEERELGAGIIDVKSFYIETADDVAERIRRFLQFVPAEKLWINPDCGFFTVPRWLTALKLNSMVAGTRIVRRELTG